MKVLIVDDHGLFRHGLEMLLTTHLNVQTTLHANSGKEALQLQTVHADIDLVLLDYNLGSDHGLDVLKQLKAKDPCLPISMISGRDDPQAILSSLGSGASGFIQKHMEPEDIIGAINLVINGGMYAPCSVIQTHPNRTSNADLETRQKQLHHLAVIARRVIRDKKLDIKKQAEVENEMTSALNNLLSELQQDRTRLELLAFKDDLTGLANRRLFLERLEQSLRSSRRNNTQLALVYLDLDHFKQLNDTEGHGAGDRLLQAIASRLLESVREVDTVARIGGDEFTLILVDIQSTQSLTKQLQRLQKRLKQSVLLDTGKPWAPSTSVGAALSDGHDSTETLIKRADEALYKVKKTGRNHFYIHQ